MSFWTNRNVFVTGATGFIGAHLARALVDRGAHVVCLQHDTIRSNALDLFDLRQRVVLVNGAVEHLPLLERILNEREIDTVFHLAAQALVGAANRSPLSTFESNIRGTYCVLEACRRSANVTRVVVASSDKAYGTHTQLPYLEEFPLLGLFPYDASKACADILSRSFALSYKLPVVVSRFANVYGPGDLNFSRIIPGTIISVLRSEAPVVRSDGTPVRDFVYIDDATAGYLTLAEHAREFIGKAFNFSAGEPLQILDLVKQIIHIAGAEQTVTPHVLLQQKIEREIDAQYLSSAQAEKELGWTAKVKLETGLRTTIDWYRTNFAQLT